MKDYKIHRECWNENTYNGYTDSPYWMITLEGNQKIGLKDNGEWWEISGVYFNQPHIEQSLKNIIDQCNLNIKIKVV